MITLILFTACQLGLRQGNPEYFLNETQEEEHTTTKEKSPENPSYTPSSQHDIIVSDPTLSQSSSIETPLISMTPNVQVEDELYNPIESIYGTSNSEEENPDEKEEREGEDCFVEIELICGPDGWVRRQLLVETDDNEYNIWSTVCETEEQSWHYQLSEIYTQTLSSGEELELSLCDTEDDCGLLAKQDLGIRIVSNDMEIENVQTPSSSWSFSYTCP